MSASASTLETGSRAASFVGTSILLAWLTYLLIAPSVGFGWIDSWHNEQRAVQILLLVSTAIAYCVLGVLQQSQEDPFRWGLPAALIFFLGIGIFSALRANYVFAAFAEVSLTALLAILVLLTARVVAGDFVGYVRWARWFALLVSAGYVLGVATRYLAAVNLERAIDFDVLVLGYANPRFASALHAVLIPFVAVTIVEKTDLRPVRVAAAIVLPLLWSINLGLGTRGIWFAYAIGMPLTVFLLGWKRAAMPLLAVVLSAVVGVAFYFLLFHLVPTLMGLGAAVAAPTDNLTTVSSREVLWRLSWEAIASSPWLGIGPMQFAALDSHIGAHPHNWVLQFGAEWGLVGLAVLLFGVLRFSRSVRRASDRDMGFVAVTSAVAVTLALGLVDGNLVMPVSQSASVLIFGLLLGSLGPVEFSRRHKWPTGPTLAISLFVSVLASAIVIAFAANTLSEQLAGASQFREAHPGAWLVPRFWEQGVLNQALGTK